MGGISLLPFLAQMKQQQGLPTNPSPAIAAEIQNSITPNPTTPQDATPDPYAGSPGGNPNIQPSAPQGIGDIAQSETAGQAAPKFQETKGHMLLRLLQSGVQGGLNGMAANAATYAQTGRNAGFGGGFQGGEMGPIQQLLARGQLAQQTAQTQLLRSQAQMVQTPYGLMPAGMAKLIFPALIRSGATEQAAQTRAGATTQAATIGANARLQAAKMGLGPVADVPQDLQDQFGLPAQLPLKMLNQAESAANKPLTVVGGANDSYVVNKQNPSQGKQPLGVGSGRIAATLARPLQVADPNNPGNVIYEPAGQAMNQGASSPQSAQTTVAKAAAKSEVPSKLGDQRVAFNTAMQHADLLKSALSALSNGNVQMLNSLQNRFATEFGSTGPITAEAIADAYSREVQKGLSSGHITEGDTAKVKKTLDVGAQSIPQSLSVLDAYKNLFGSKMNQLDKQKGSAITQTKPNKAQQQTTNDPMGIR